MLKQLSVPYVIALYPSNLLMQVEDRGEGAVEMVGEAMVTEAPHRGATSNRNHPERSHGPPPSPSGNSTTCPNREEVRAHSIPLIVNTVKHFMRSPCQNYSLKSTLSLVLHYNSV